MSPWGLTTMPWVEIFFADMEMKIGILPSAHKLIGANLVWPALSCHSHLTRSS